MLKPMFWSKGDRGGDGMKMPLNCCNPDFEWHVMEIAPVQEPLVACQAGSKGRSALQC